MKVELNKQLCTNCNLCSLVSCPKIDVKKAIKSKICIGCGACLSCCPKEALNPDNNQFDFKEVAVIVNGKSFNCRGLVKDALQKAGIILEKYPSTQKNRIFSPCGIGACWACAVKINGQYALSCITPLTEGMKIDIIENPPPLRVVSGFGAHSVGGVGTPYNLKMDNQPVEVIVFTHGCNLLCKQCQNYQMAFTSGGHLMDSNETAQILLGLQNQFKVNRIAISGGESTLNYSWLLKVIEYIREQNQDVEIHVDTNGTLLTPDYIDALVNAGLTHIGVDIKSLYLSTFMQITGLEDEKLAEKYLNNSWAAVEYIIKNKSDDIFLGIGIPYNECLISKNEIEKIGKRIAKLDINVQVSLLDYRGEFRLMSMIKPSVEEMLELKSILNMVGLKKVIAQTEQGHVGP